MVNFQLRQQGDHALVHTLAFVLLKEWSQQRVFVMKIMATQKCDETWRKKYHKQVGRINVTLPPIHSKRGRMKQFVKALVSSGHSFAYICSNIPYLSYGRKKAWIFDASQIRMSWQQWPLLRLELGIRLIMLFITSLAKWNLKVTNSRGASLLSL